MTIKEVEEQTGLARSNVRFYEKEKLIEPLCKESNGYRDYSEADVENIKKIAYLRTLGIPVEEIRNVISKKTMLRDVLEHQSDTLAAQLADLKQAKLLCEKMLSEDTISYDDLQVERYVAGLQDYWQENEKVFKLDSVSFLYLWGSTVIWTLLTALGIVIGIFSYAKLPPEIPVQWNGGEVSSLADKSFIFVYPAACIVIRYLLKQFLYAKLQTNDDRREMVTAYITNYMCFVALSAEIFTILFIYGVVKSIVTVLFVDTVVLIGMLVIGLTKQSLR